MHLIRHFLDFAGKKRLPLASHILQWVYVSHNGFRFPFAHHATAEAQAADLYLLLWDAIEYGFQVLNSVALTFILV